jgi:hypothetical protein
MCCSTLTLFFFFLVYSQTADKKGSTTMPEVLQNDCTVASDEPDFSIFENKSGLAEDLKFLASIPELCVRKCFKLAPEQ